jgi:Na+-driven multidrug efflux pump
MHFVSFFANGISSFTEYGFFPVLWWNKTSQLIQSSLCVHIIQQANAGNINIVWWSFPIAEVISLLISLFFFRKIQRDIIDQL